MNATTARVELAEADARRGDVRGVRGESGQARRLAREDVATEPAGAGLHLSHEGALVGGGGALVDMRDGEEVGGLGRAEAQQVVGGADDRGGVQAAGQLGGHRRRGAEAAADRGQEQLAEALLVLCVAGELQRADGVETPPAYDPDVPLRGDEGATGRHRAQVAPGGQGWIDRPREVTRDPLLFDLAQGDAGGAEGAQGRGPDELAAATCVEERPGPERIARQDEPALPPVAWAPKGTCWTAMTIGPGGPRGEAGRRSAQSAGDTRRA